MIGAHVTLVIRFIVISGALTEWNWVATLKIGVEKRIIFAAETSHILVPSVELAVDTICAVFRAVVTPIFSTVVISALMAN